MKPFLLIKETSSHLPLQKYKIGQMQKTTMLYSGPMIYVQHNLYT